MADAGSPLKNRRFGDFQLMRRPTRHAEPPVSQTRLDSIPEPSECAGAPRHEWHFPRQRNELRLSLGDVSLARLSPGSGEQVVLRRATFDGAGFDAIGAIPNAV